MPKSIFLIFLVCLIGIFAASPNDDSNSNYILYEIDLTKTDDDLFHVTMFPGKLSPENQYFNFVAFAPGVHQVLDYGRFVKSLTAYDKNDSVITTEKLSLNKWLISTPEKVYRIDYVIEDSFDAEVEEHPIYPMSGTGIENDFIILNTFGVLGYFDGLLNKPVQMEIDYNPEWKIGTALEMENGYYVAESYYHLADSPILLGDLTTASAMIGDIEVEVFVYSENDTINADTVLYMAEDVLNAAVEFTKYAPVNRYSFLMYFLNDETYKRNGLHGGGALEHSYSSTYAFQAKPEFMFMLRDVIAHEFMHILTPLNLRSEIIADFDYSKPSSEDKHVWLYEGVTEWVSLIMLLRSGVDDIESHLSAISRKLRNSESYDSTYSLTRISREWSTDEGNKQYGNIYQRGAVTAELLDIRLLELSGGTRGLREVYLDLIKQYGKEKPFDNDTFFDIIVKMTYPEIEEFINDYIRGTASLPYQEYFEKLGIKYSFSQPSENKTPVFGLHLGSSDGKHLSISGFSRVHKDFGLKEGDIILKVFGEDVSLKNASEIIERKNKMKIGDTYDITIIRGDEELTFTGTLFERMDYHILNVGENSAGQQNEFRDIWSNYLSIDE
jgi:predicted metalloprotease with PDZ domain